MKLSDNTIKLLKNYSTINPSILFRATNVLATVHPMKQIAARAAIAETFPQEVAIYDLSQFLSVLSLFKEPELEFGERQVVISSGSQKVYYTYAEPATIKAAPADIDLPFPDNAVSFELSATALQTLTNSCYLGHEQIAITGDGEDVEIGTHSKDKTASSYKLSVAKSDHEFMVVVSGENFKMLPRDYTVTVCKNFTRFQSGEIIYWLVNEHTSKF